MSHFCTECGTPRGSADERFCGSCGAPQQVTAPAAAAAPPPVHASAQAVPAAPPFPPSAADPWAGPGPAYTPLTSSTERPRRSRGSLRIAAVATTLVLALSGGAVVAWQVLGPSGGASTPEAAVDTFVTALAAQDVVAALDMVVPAEVAEIDEVYGSVTERLERLDLTPSGRVTDVATIELSDLSYDTRELSADLASVSLAGGSYQVSVDPSKFPAELAVYRDDVPRRTYSGDLVGPGRELVAEAFYETTYTAPWVVTVRVDGRWYVSLVATAADWYGGGWLQPSAELVQDAREDGYRLPDPAAVTTAVDPIVGADVEEVLYNLAAAISAGDFQQLYANLPQDQLVGLRPFIAFLTDAMRLEGVSLRVDVTDLTYETSTEGDHLRVTLDSAAVSASASEDGYDVESVSARLLGTCGYAAEDGYSEEGGCVPGTFTETLGIDKPFLLLREVEGGYQLDPVATAVAYAEQAVETVPDHVLRELVRAIGNESSYDACVVLGLAELC